MEVFGLTDSEARKILLKEFLAKSKIEKQVGGETFGHSLKLIGLILMIRKNIFSKNANKRRREFRKTMTTMSQNQERTTNKLSEQEIFRVAEILLESNEKERQQSEEMETTERHEPFFDVIASKPFESDYGSASEVWSRILKTYFIEDPKKFISGKVKNFMVMIVRHLIDICDGKLFKTGYDWDNNIVLMFGADILMNKILNVAASMSRRFVTSFSSKMIIESFSSAMGQMASSVMAETVTRTLGMVFEEALVRAIITSAIRTALSIFVKLAALAGEIVSAIGIVITMVSLLGIALDLGLGLGWYEEQVLDQKKIDQYIEVFETEFRKAEEISMKSSLRTVSAEELTSIAIELELNEMNNKTKRYDVTGRDAATDFADFIDTYFNRHPLLNMTKHKFLNQAMFEYLGGRKMNSLGQPLHSNSDLTSDEHIDIMMRNRNALSETAQRIENYSHVIRFNTSKLDYIGDDWWSPQVNRQEMIKSDILFNRLLGYSAAAGAVLVASLGVTAVFHFSNIVKATNISIAIAFIGLLAFISFAGIAYINIYSIGKLNSSSLKRRLGEEKHEYTKKTDVLDESSRIRRPIITNSDGSNDFKKRCGIIQNMVNSGTKFQIFKNFLDPLLVSI